jgi:DNA mismatch repair protein MutL
LRTSYRERAVKTQSLLFPERVECAEAEVALVQEHQDALLALGLDCGVLGPTTVAIRAVPALLHRAPPERLLRDVLSELSRTGERAFADAVDMALATMACHGSIRAGDALSSDECAALLRSMDDVDDFATHCPHGRPVIYSIDFEQLERRLGR